MYLYNDWQDGSLDPNPNFQREYVWDDKQASLLIESLLLNVPIPLVYTSEENGIESVIDGQQRLTSCFRYLNNEFPLKGLKIFEKLQNCYFKDLDIELKNKIRKYSLSVVRIKQESDEEVKFEIFERINSGSVNLNTQEIRNCIYRGIYNEFIKECAKNELLIELFFGKEIPKRMENVELVLRFFAFYKEPLVSYSGTLKGFLNNHMKTYSNIINDMNVDERTRTLNKMRKDFKKSLELIKIIFDRYAFKTFTLKDKSTFKWGTTNKSLFDVLMYGFTQYEKSQVMNYCDSIREGLIKLIINNDEFLPKSGTMSKEKVRYRFNLWINELQSIITSQKQPRSFSFQIKKDLFDKNSTCSICNQKINSIEIAEVDHHKPYWKGGETIPENARLTHYICNRIKSGK